MSAHLKVQSRPGVKILLSVALVGILSTACGKGRAGNYVGNEAIQNMTASQVTIALTEAKSDQVTGTYASSSLNGTFTGTLTGDSITNVILTAPVQNPQVQAPAAMTPGSPGMMNPAAATTNPCGATQYTGTLNLTDDKMTGSLTAVQPAGTPVANQGYPQQPGTYPQQPGAYPQQQGYGYQSSYASGTNCSVVRTIDTTKTN